MRDALKPVRDMLLAHQPLVDLVGQRVYCHRDNPPEGYAVTTGPCVCLKTRGGDIDATDELLVLSVQIKCIGRSEVEANAVYRALFQALHGRQAAIVRWAMCEVLGQTLIEPETKWVVVLTYFEVHIQKD
jgi:hypothetical protein